MSHPNDRHKGPFGRELLDQLSAQLSQSKRAKNLQTGDQRRSAGFISQFSNVISTNLTDEFNRGRKFNAQELQLLLLALLSDKPAHGYELIKALETLSNGFYSPSPGVMYPALTHLDEIGHIQVTLYGNRKSYALSDLGKRHLTEHQEQVDAMWSKLTNVARKMDSVRQAFANEAPINTAWIPELIAANNALKAALTDCHTASETEQQRVAKVLMQAAENISNKP